MSDAAVRTPLTERISAALGIYPKPRRPVITDRQYREIYSQPESFAQYLRVRYHDAHYRAFVMDDERSCGVAFEIGHLTAQDRAEDVVQELHERVSGIFEHVTERDVNPWIVEFFTQNMPLQALRDDMINYTDQVSGKDDALARDYRQRLTEHFEDLTATDGLFHEGNYPWRGQRRRTFMLLYRTYDKSEKHLRDNLREVSDLAERIENGLSASNIRHHRLDGNDYYQWLYPWFNRASSGETPEQHAARNPFIESESREGVPDFEVDLIDWVMGADQPESGSPEPDDGVWRWGDHYVRFVPVVGQKVRPDIGAVTIANSRADAGDFSQRPLFYRLPENAIFTMKIVFVPQDLQQMDIETLGAASRATTTSARATKAVVEPALEAMGNNHRLYPVYMGYFIRDKSKQAVLHSAQIAISEISTNRFRCIDLDDDLFALDEAVRSLPFGYEPAYDSFLMRRYPMWLHDIVSIMPVWGQTEIQGHPCLLWFDRFGNPVAYDPLSSDRQRVPHTFIGGPTGSGKSACLNAMLLSLVATHRPVLYLIDFGGSYRLLAEYLRTMGMTVSYTQCTQASPVAFPVFGDAQNILDQLDGNIDPTATDDEDRVDWLSQALMICKIMLANGKKKAFEAIERADDSIIQEAIGNAVRKRAIDPEHQQLLPEDIARELRIIATAKDDGGDGYRFTDGRRDVITKMADAVAYYTHGFYGRMFNTPVTDKTEFDVNIIDIDTFGKDEASYNDALTLVWVGILNHLQELADRNIERRQERPILLVNDEAHITFKAEMLPPALARGSKTFRKKNIAMFLATQDLDDVPIDAGKIVSMMEYKVLLTAPKDELEKLEKLIDITDEQRRMILSCTKSPGKFAEGVLISAAWPPQIFRNVPIALAMALGQTEAHERKNRNRIKDEHDYETENEVTEHVARELRESRRQHSAGSHR